MIITFITYEKGGDDACFVSDYPEAIGSARGGVRFPSGILGSDRARQLAERYNLAPFVELNVKLNMLWTALGENGDLDAIHKFVFDNTDSYWHDYMSIEHFDSIKRTSWPRAVFRNSMVYFRHRHAVGHGG